MRSITVSITTLALMLAFTSGCKDLKRQLEAKARENSLRKNTQQASLGPNGCPPGTVPGGELGSNGLPTFCKSPEYDGNSVERIGENWPNGKPKVRYVMQGDNLRVTHYFQNGNIKEEAHFSNNEKHGLWAEWYSNGKVKARGEYLNNKKDGMFTEYNQQGVSKEAGRYRDGKRSGLWVFYGPTGKIIRRTEYAEDLRHGNEEVLNAKGVLLQHGSYFADKKEGRWLGYYSDGSKRVAGSYKADKKDGRWITYQPDGRTQQVVFYKEDRIVPKQGLRGEVAFSNGDTLGARPPSPSDRTAAPKRSAKPVKGLQKGPGWKPL